jgi:hypothetical protein
MKAEWVAVVGENYVGLKDIEHAQMELELIEKEINPFHYNLSRKKKKPCTSHEYTLRGTVETSPNIFTEIWKCRYCQREL